MITPIRVCVADDHVAFRRGVKHAVMSTDTLILVGEASDANEAVKLAQRTQPDVFLMDIQMPGGSGIDATRKIRETQPAMGILMLTMFEDDESVFAALRAGARGYIIKGTGQSELIRAITTVANGGAVFGPRIAHHLVTYFNSKREQTPTEKLPELTPREIEVLTLISKGTKNATIAETLVISPKTVRNHISNIFSKLHVTDRQSAIDIARNAGLDDENNSAK